MSESESNKADKRKGRKPKFDYTSEEFLSSVESYAKKGFTDKEIAHVLGLSPQTFCEKKGEFVELSEVLSCARSAITAVVRAKFLSMAMGGIKTRSVTVRKLKDTDGNLTGEEEIQSVESELAPNLHAQSVWLYHYDEDWRKVERKQDANSDDIPKDIDEGISVSEWVKGLMKKKK